MLHFGNFGEVLFDGIVWCMVRCAGAAHARHARRKRAAAFSTRATAAVLTVTAYCSRRRPTALTSDCYHLIDTHHHTTLYLRLRIIANLYLTFQTLFYLIVYFIAYVYYIPVKCFS